MVRRIVLSLAALLLGVSGSAVVAAPAAAWTYCSPSTAVGTLNLFDNQGYCGDSYQWYVVPGQCVYLDSPAPGNFAGSVWNRTSRGIILSSQTNCQGDSVAIPAGTSHPNLYSINGDDFGNTVSSFYVA